jgi:hypothetical protein
MVFNPKYGKFGVFTLPANFAMLVFTPLIILVGICSLFALTFFDLYFSLVIWGILGAISLFSLVVSKHLLITFLDFEVSLLKALYEIAFTKRKHDQIDRVLSTRAAISGSLRYII